MDVTGTWGSAAWQSGEADARFKWVQKGVKGGRWQMVAAVSRSISVGGRAKTPVRKVSKGGRCFCMLQCS